MGKDVLEFIDCGFYVIPNIINDYQIPIIDSRTGKERVMDAYEKLTLLCIYRYSNSKKRAFPSYRNIAFCIGCGVSKAQLAVNNLVSNGFLIKSSRGYSSDNGSCKKTRSNVYKVNQDKIVKIKEFGVSWKEYNRR